MIRFNLLLILFCVTSFFVIAQDTKKHANSKQTAAEKFKINGEATIAYEYCGGVRPNQEMLDEMLKPKPYVGKTFYVRKGKLNSTKQPIVLSFTVANDGTFSFELPAGVYSIIQEEQVNKIKLDDYNKDNNGLKTDIACLKNWWHKPYYLIVLNNKNINPLHFKFTRNCFIPNDIPCTQYIGPLPE